MRHLVSTLQSIYSAAKSGSLSASVAVELGSQLGLVHVDDVATGFHGAIDKLPLISGTGVYPGFDLAFSQESMKDIFDAAGREFGFKGTVELKGAGDDVFMKALSTSSNSTESRAKTLLRWEPRKVGSVQGIDVYARAWVASKL